MSGHSTRYYDIHMKAIPCIACFVAAFFVVWLTAWGNSQVSPPPVSDLRVELLPIDVDGRDPARVNFDRLRLMSAFQLQSEDSRFGGLSGLAIGADGKLYAVSDRGYWFSAVMHLDASGRLLNLSNWKAAKLLTPDKTPVGKKLQDAEALARTPDGSFIVAFEQLHRIWRYLPPPMTFSSAAVQVPVPSQIFKASRNGGLEAVGALPDGRILAIAETLKTRHGAIRAWLIDADKFTELSYAPSDGFSPSDATALENGNVLVLERRFEFLRYFSARIKLVGGRDLRPSARLVGDELLRLDTPLTVDNFEGIAAMETGDGTAIFLISDDNFFPLQSTLLFQFLLPKNEK